jgi:hypothetical protein
MMGEWRVLTNRDHTLIIIIQILLDNLQQRRNRPPILTITHILITQKLILRLHLRKRTRQPPHHSFIRDLINFHTYNEAEVEHELISYIFLIFDADWVTEDAVFVVWVANTDEAVAERLSGDDVFGHDFEVKKAWFVDIGF